MAAKSGPIVVAVDGPAGSGKSSICREAAQKLGWQYLGTGHLYRGVAWLIIQRRVDLEDHQALSKVLDAAMEGFSWHEELGLRFEGRPVSDVLESMQVSQIASAAAKIPLVRDRLLPLQRRIILEAPKGVIVDGRDIATVVCPDADLKIFMTASIEERARRRLNQMGISRDEASLEQVISAISARDSQDEQRGAAPLKRADDAFLFDNSTITREQAVEQLIELIRSNTP